jgi:peptidoglycan/xylan/chitin deacetylase (PgdA/CDA1 family)
MGADSQAVRSARGATRRAARETVGGLVRLSRAGSIARRVRAERRAGILVYHDPDAATLERHLDYLERRHRFVPYAAVASAVATGDWSEVPPKAIAITFDDGHTGNLSLFPLLEERGITPTVFLCTGLVGTRRRFWFSVDGLTRQERYRLMRLPDDERVRTLRSYGGWSPTREYEDAAPQALSTEDAVALLGRVDFQAHTRWHPVLTQCDDDAARAEIAGSRADVERLLGVECRHFAYPHGRYEDREVELARQAGYRSARTTEIGWNEPGVDPLRLRVLGIPDDASVGVLAAQSTGLPGLRRLMYVT